MRQRPDREDLVERHVLPQHLGVVLEAAGGQYHCAGGDLSSARRGLHHDADHAAHLIGQELLHRRVIEDLDTQSTSELLGEHSEEGRAGTLAAQKGVSGVAIVARDVGDHQLIGAGEGVGRGCGNCDRVETDVVGERL